MVLYRYMLLVRWQIMETPNKILLRSVTRCCACRRACLPPKSPVECEVALMAWLVRRLRALMVEEPLCAGDLTCRQPQRRSSFERERLSTGDISVQRAQRQQRRSFDLAQQQQRRSFEESLRVQQQRRSSQRSRRSSHGRVSRRTSGGGSRWPVGDPFARARAPRAALEAPRSRLSRRRNGAAGPGWRQRRRRPSQCRRHHRRLRPRARRRRESGWSGWNGSSRRSGRGWRRSGWRQ